MDAEKPKAAELSLPQAFLLLATNDKDGKPEVPVFALRTTVAGAILAELDLLGAIGLEGKHVRATGTAPQTDFQHELELIRGKSRPHTPKQWVSMLEGRAEVQRVYEGMASLGIVEHVGEKHLGLFKSTRYPEKDHGPEAALLEKIEAALSGAPADACEAWCRGCQNPRRRCRGADAKASDAEPDSRVRRRAGASLMRRRLTASATVRPLPSAPDAQGARCQDRSADRPASGGRVVRQALPGSRSEAGHELAKDYWPSRAVEDELDGQAGKEEEATL